MQLCHYFLICHYCLILSLLKPIRSAGFVLELSSTPTSMAEEAGATTRIASEDSSSSDSDEDMVPPSQLQALRAAVQSNPDNFSAHADLVRAYRTNGDFAKLRSARKTFAARLPWPEGV